MKKMQEWKEKELLTKKNLAEKRLNKKAKEKLDSLETKEEQLTTDYNKKAEAIKDKYEITKLEEEQKKLEKTIERKKEEEERFKQHQKLDDEKIEKIELGLKIKEQDRENIKYKLDEERKGLFKKIFRRKQIDPAITPKTQEQPEEFFKKTLHVKNDIEEFNELTEQTEELFKNKDKSALIKIYKQAREIYLKLPPEDKRQAHDRLSNIYIKIKTL